jgi:hypothetical protein
LADLNPWQEIDVKTVTLGGAKAAGRVALVDDDDYPLVSEHRWSVREKLRDGRPSVGPYAITNMRRDGKQATVFMHHLIMGTKGVAHLNRQGLDNRRANLQAGADMSQRRGPNRGHSSRYKGVTWHVCGQWAARITLDGKRRHLGLFGAEEEAALAYDAAARAALGDLARLNFPDPALAQVQQRAAEELASHAGPAWTPAKRTQESLSEEEQASMVTRYQGRESIPQIAASLDVWTSAVCRTLRRNGVAMRLPSERSGVRHDAFDELTPDAAYWCGFLFADGSIVSRPDGNPQVVVALTASDRGHLEKFREFLGATQAITMVPGKTIAHTNGKTYSGRPTCRFAVTSVRLADRLRVLGRYEGAVDERLARSRDFWRGAVDGDGHVGISAGMPAVALTGSRRVLTHYADFVNVPGARRPLHVNWARTTHAVSATCGTAERIAELLYRDASTALDRKAAMAAQIRRSAAPGR